MTKATTLFLTSLLLILSVSASMAATDSFYTLTSTTAVWDGTTASRHLPKTADYDYTYGDDESITYTLPWGFAFYGQTFNEITADTNGNVWFGVSGSGKSFSLANNGRGSVISAWNNDLSSYYYGGVYIQHKSSPDERVVIEWHTETYTREGFWKPNQFEIVLYPNGNIRLDYKSFSVDTTNKDFGSGISFNDDKFFINLTSDSGSVFGLAGRSFLATVTGTVKTLDIAFDGTGSGAVSSNHPVSWTASKPAFFPTGAQITLQPMPGSGGNIFDGWSGPCNGKGTCTVQLNENRVVTARFNRSNVWIDGKWGYTGLQEAYNAAENGDVIKAQALTFAEDLNLNRPISVDFDGGYNFDFNARAGITTLTGMMFAADGVSTMSSFQIGAGVPSPSTFFTIDAATTVGGSITPPGRLSLTPGTNYTFKMYAHTGYKLVDVIVDGVSVGTPSAYSFSNITANHTIKAFYVARLTIAKSGDGSVTVTSAPAAISCGTTCFSDFVPGTTVVLAATPDVYTTFTGWSGGGCSGTATCTLTMNADTTVTAHFDTYQYPLNFTMAGNDGMLLGSTSQYVLHSTSSSAVTAVPPTGYHFINWTGTNGFVTTTENPLVVSNVTAAQNITANFGYNGVDGSVTFQYGDGKTYTASPNGWYTDWTPPSSVTAKIICNGAGGGGGSPSYYDDALEMDSFAATGGSGGFSAVAPVANPVLFISQAAGGAGGSTGSYLGEAGMKSVTAPVQISAAPYRIYVGAGGGAGAGSFTEGEQTTGRSYSKGTGGTSSTGAAGGGAGEFASNGSVTISWPEYTVDFIPGANGSLSGTSSQNVSRNGSATAVTAVPATGSHFVNWTGTGGFVTTSSNPLIVSNVTASQTITANFTKNQYPVTFTAGANGSLTGAMNQTVNHGENATAVTAVPAVGHHFVNWTGTGGFVTTTANPLTVSNVTAPKSITATFDINQYAVYFVATGDIYEMTSQLVPYNGSTTAVTAVPPPGFQFVNWTGSEGFVTTTSNPLTVNNVTASQVIYANFTCSAGYSYNGSRDRCEKVPVCASGTYNPFSDKCETNSSYTAAPVCGYGLTYNTGTARCETSSYCSSGTYNQSNQKCEYNATNSYTATNGCSTAYIAGTPVAYTHNIGKLRCEASSSTACNAFATAYYPPGSAGQLGHDYQGDLCTDGGEEYVPMTSVCWAAGNSNYDSNAEVCYTPPSLSCNVGDPLSGSLCMHSIVMQVNPSCSYGTWNTSSHKCDSAISGYSCPSGGSLSGATCSLLVIADPTCVNGTLDGSNNVCWAN